MRSARQCLRTGTDATLIRTEGLTATVSECTPCIVDNKCGFLTKTKETGEKVNKYTKRFSSSKVKKVKKFQSSEVKKTKKFQKRKNPKVLKSENKEKGFEKVQKKVKKVKKVDKV